MNGTSSMSHVGMAIYYKAGHGKYGGRLFLCASIIDTLQMASAPKTRTKTIAFQNRFSESISRQYFPKSFSPTSFFEIVFQIDFSQIIFRKCFPQNRFSKSPSQRPSASPLHLCCAAVLCPPSPLSLHLCCDAVLQVAKSDLGDKRFLRRWGNRFAETVLKNDFVAKDSQNKNVGKVDLDKRL